MKEAKTPHETFQKLQAKLGEVESRQKVLAGERTAIAYDALTGDAKAARRLQDICSALAVIDQEIASVHAAIQEAARRVAEADDQERAKREAEKRKQAMALSADLVAQASDLDAHLQTFFKMYNSFRNEMIELNRLGAGPNINVVDSVCRRALETASMGTRLQLVHLAPTDRVTFEELATSWKAHTAAWALDKSAGQNKPKVKEAA
jgi:hypothetical protein